jgi:ornithine cyclodeaminase
MSGRKMKIRIISGSELRHVAPMAAVIPAIRSTMIEVSNDQFLMPLRHAMPTRESGGALGIMSGAACSAGKFGIKLISLYPDNPSVGLSSHMGLMLLFDSDSGKPLALTDGSVVTALRTAAASAVATDALARQGSLRLAILGTGEQARAHLEAIPIIRPLRSVSIWGRSRAKADELAQELAQGDGVAISSAASAQDAVREADIICTVTAAKEPILRSEWVLPGAHINAVGSSTADRAELDNDLVLRSRYFVDSRQSALAQAGEFLRCKATGLIDNDHIAAEIGEVLGGSHEGRSSEHENTIYKSLGVIAQDIALVTLAYEAAVENNIGTDIDL